MRSVSPVRPLRRLLPALPIALLTFYGCSDASSPVAPRVPARPHALVGPAITVTNTDDAGAGSLRQAILDVAPGSTIQFDAAIAGQTIVLSTGHLVIDKGLTIEGPLPAGMRISGGLTSSVFLVKTTGDLVLRNLSIVDGRNKFAGGMDVEGSATLDHSLLANNEADEGSGGGILVRDTGELSLVNSTVSGNSAARDGGGIYSQGKLSIRNSTVAFNVSRDGGGGVFISDGSFSVRNSIIADNAGDDGPAVIDPNCHFDSGVPLVFAGRNISNDQDCGIDPAMIIATPLLGALASNGGPTKTHALLMGSPAIDAGTMCSESTDQRYIARNQGSSCDIGAFEFDTFGTITITIGPNVAVNAKTGTATVAGMISCSRPAATPLSVSLSQTQKTVGKFTTIVQAAANIPATCTSTPSSWSLALTPETGKFQPGSATGSATVLTVPGGFLPATVTSSLKLFQVK